MPSRFSTILEQISPWSAMSIRVLQGCLAESQNAAAVIELDEVFARAPDGLIIASSTASHGDVALAAIRAGIPFLCEKPLAFDLETAAKIAEEAAAKGVTGGHGL